MDATGIGGAKAAPALYRAIRGLGLFIALAAGSAQAFAAGMASGNVLLAIDQSRPAVVERIVEERGAALAQSGAGITPDNLRALLLQLRADQLLAASMAGTLDGLRDVIARSLAGTDAINPALLQPTAASKGGGGLEKAVGDVSDDVSYTPITPCRLVETRGTFPAVYQGNGTPSHTANPFSASETRTYAVQGGNGVCTSQLPSGLGAAAVQLQVFGMPIGGTSGDIEILPQGSTFGSTATEVFVGSIAFNTVSTTAKINVANNQISVQVRGGSANVAIVVVGYFKTPGSYGTNISETGEYASVAGGDHQTASGKYSFIGGGSQNTASGDYSAVLGGNRNTASGTYGSVIGGVDSSATGFESTTLGGQATREALKNSLHVRGLQLR
jgi:hypothetical protein